MMLLLHTELQLLALLLSPLVDAAAAAAATFAAGVASFKATQVESNSNFHLYASLIEGLNTVQFSNLPKFTRVAENQFHEGVSISFRHPRENAFRHPRKFRFFQVLGPPMLSIRGSAVNFTT